MRIATYNQWSALRDWTRDAPRSVQMEALGMADRFQWAKPLKDIPWDILDSNAALRDRAEQLARACSWSGALEGMERIAIGAGVAPPAQTLTRVGRVARLVCPYWWRRRLRAVWGERAEYTLRRFGMVHRRRGAYVTDFTRRRRRNHRRAMYEALESATLVNEAGDELDLLALWKGSTANPAVRRAELMCRLRGFERIAKDLGHVARLYTLTAPSAFHAITTVDGTAAPNPRYDGANVAEAHAWLMRKWARIRAQLKRKGVLVYGFRICEPHHDGTPHLHVLLWMPASERVRVRRVIRGHMWSEYRDEPGMRRHRFNAKAIHPSLGSAVGYLAKYIAKNVDGFNVGADSEATTDAKRGSRRAEAWATCHRIRQFQQIGGPPVGLWRELRRLREKHPSEALERARCAADAGDWSAFIAALGGLEAWRGGSISLWKEQTGELGRYGDVRPAQVAGVQGPDGRVRTRCHVWRVRWGSRLRVPPWTRVNNCTGTGVMGVLGVVSGPSGGPAATGPEQGGPSQPESTRSRHR
jgi:hypothetical protein